jgi:hypothetical protein
MKMQRMNPNNMNPMQMNNVSNMAGMMNNIQKIGKGKRKYTVQLDKNSKKFLSKFIDEIKKQFNGPMVGQGQGIIEFFNYVKEICDSKDKNELRLSFEELEFMKKMLSDTIKGLENVKFKWYQFARKMMVKVMLKQYKEILVQINK